MTPDELREHIADARERAGGATDRPVFAALRAAADIIENELPPVGSVVYPPGALDEHAAEIAEAREEAEDQKQIAIGIGLEKYEAIKERDEARADVERLKKQNARLCERIADLEPAPLDEDFTARKALEQSE
jgi:hypothetical protein